MSRSTRTGMLVGYCISAAVCAGCVAPPLDAAGMESGPLAFLQDGSTTRERALMRLGEPTGNFESGRILTWRIANDNKRGFDVIANERVLQTETQSYQSVNFSLVLVFDGQRLAKHSVVPVK